MAEQLFEAARQVETVTSLLSQGVDVNTREDGDNTCAMHWAAAAGQLDVVRRLADAGGDVVGAGDDHQLEVIGWATCWDGCDDDEHRAVADFLVSRGAKHHIFSAMALNMADEVRNIVARDPSSLNKRMSRNESHQLPLHFVVRKNLRDMVELLVELGADPIGVDDSGFTAAAYATTPDIDKPVMELISTMTSSELLSARRGNREPQLGSIDLLAALGLGDFDRAEVVWKSVMSSDNTDSAGFGALHMMSKRGDSRAVRWLLDHGANASALWAHWDADVTPLHLAALADHADVAALLLNAGADPSIRDSKHDSDALGWAEFFGRLEMVSLLRRQITTHT
jgi:ankyrin repeat protein